MIQIPEHAEVYEFSNSTIWFDESGILWSVSKIAPPQTVDQVRKELNQLKDIIGGRKVCMLIDVTNTAETTREVRDFAAEELPKITVAIAMVSKSPLGKMFANLFFSIKSQPYPVKMFSNSADAKKWLTQFL